MVKCLMGDVCNHLELPCVVNRLLTPPKQVPPEKYAFMAFVTVSVYLLQDMHAFNFCLCFMLDL